MGDFFLFTSLCLPKDIMIYPWANLQVGLAKHQEQANAEQDFCSYAYLFALLYTIYILKAEIFRDAN